MKQMQIISHNDGVVGLTSLQNEMTGLSIELVLAQKREKGRINGVPPYKMNFPGLA